MLLLQTYDYQGFKVVLTSATWFKKVLDPVFGHPEVKPYQSQLRRSIRTPEYVYQSIKDPRSKLFFHTITKSDFSSYFLVVVVKYVLELKGMVGYVSTVMINRRLPKRS